MSTSIPPPTAEQIALVERMISDLRYQAGTVHKIGEAFKAARLDEVAALWAVLAYARLGVETAEIMARTDIPPCSLTFRKDKMDLLGEAVERLGLLATPPEGGR